MSKLQIRVNGEEFMVIDDHTLLSSVYTAAIEAGYDDSETIDFIEIKE
ncbi:MAG: hypothetical protein ACRCX2_30025 [Paraclostridium sp.]